MERGGFCRLSSRRLMSRSQHPWPLASETSPPRHPLRTSVRVYQESLWASEHLPNTYRGWINSVPCSGLQSRSVRRERLPPFLGMPAIPAPFGTDPLPRANRTQGTVAILALLGSGFSVGAHLPVVVSLHQHAKSSQKCVSCIWEGVALRVPSSPRLVRGPARPNQPNWCQRGAKLSCYTLTL